MPAAISSDKRCRKERLRVVACPAFRGRENNPYTSLLYDKMQAIGQSIEEFKWTAICRRMPDILHVHWPEHQILTPQPKLKKIVQFLLFNLYVRLVRVHGGQVIWTAHNAFGHDKVRSSINLLLWSRFLSLLTGVIYLSQASRRAIEKDWPVLTTRPSAVIPHGHYIDWLEQVTGGISSKSPHRQALGLPDTGKVFLSFGQIRPYKNVELLIDEFKQIEDETVRLIIAGEASDVGLRQAIIRAADRDPRITCTLRRLDAKELADALAIADVVVLPYREITNSGAALLALSAHRRVLAPNMGSLPELQRHVGEEWLKLYDGPFSRSVLVSALGWCGSPPRSLSMAPFDWLPIATETIEFYRSLQ